MPPVAILAFANNRIDDRQALRNLPAEEQGIRAAMEPLVAQRALAEPHVLSNATVDRVQEAFLNPRLADRVAIFHFGGHASGTELVLEDERGGPSPSHAGGLAGFLGQQEGLVLVFLNGCSTEAQVARLRECGVKAVIATSQAIEDEVAARFAEVFYTALRSHPLGKAYGLAQEAIKNKWGPRPADVVRSSFRDAMIEPDEDVEPKWPWVLEHEPGAEQWRPRAVVSETGEARTRPWTIIGAAGLLGVLVGGSVLLLGDQADDQAEQGKVASGGVFGGTAAPARSAAATSSRGAEPDAIEPAHVMSGNATLDAATTTTSASGSSSAEATDGASGSGTTAVSPEPPRPQTHCKIDAEYQDRWKPGRCTTPRIETLDGRRLRAYKDSHPKHRRCDTITLYSCD